MDVLVVIPAVAGTVLRPLAGRPLIAHAIEQARAARRVSRLVVVAEVAEVGRIADDWGAEFVELDAETPLGASPAVVLSSALEVLADRSGYAPGVAIYLDPECPLRAAETIDGAVDHLLRCGADSLISVHPLEDRLWVQDEGGIAQPFNHRPTERRFVENGAVLAVRVGIFEPEGTFPAGRTVLYEAPAWEAFRLGDEDDWLAAEALLVRFRGQRLRRRLQAVQLLALDFDGVMTDNRVLVFEDGREAVLCSRGDGMGLDLLRATGIPILVISKEGNPVVTARCRKLKIPCEQGVADKLPVLERAARERGVALSQVAFMGNDVNDLSCLRAVGLGIAPADAHPQVLRQADLITIAAGGVGAVREVCDLLMAANVENEAPADS
jgi:N-acylneuraminate cytidylyltransferase